MPMSIGSFDVIIRIDWLSLQRVKVLYYEKVIRLPLLNNEAIVIYRDKSGKNLRIITFMKEMKYFQKKCFYFVARVVDMQVKGKEIKDIMQVCDYPFVFSEDLPGVPPV